MPHLRVLLGYQQGQVYSLDARPTVIGRDPASEIILDSESPASRRHAEILCEDGEWILRDLGSRNGTHVNGIRVERSPLNHLDEVLLGDSLFIFEYNDRLTSETVAAASRAMPRSPLGLQNVPAIQELVKSVGNTFAHCPALVREIMTAIVAGGHVLLPRLADSAASAILTTIRRISELGTGSLRFHHSLALDELVKGNVGAAHAQVDASLFTNVFLAEDIDKASGDVQAAIVDAMKERPARGISQKWILPSPFCILATSETTASKDSRPLSPAILDHFMFSVNADSNDAVQAANWVPDCALSTTQIADLMGAVRDTSLDENLVNYAAQIACATRPTHRSAPSFVKRYVTSGAGSNAAYSLLIGAKARAVISGRMIANSDDILGVVPAVLRHRIALKSEAADEAVDVERIVRKLSALDPWEAGT